MSLRRNLASLILFISILPAEAFAREEPSTPPITNTWTSNDWFAGGLVIPSPPFYTCPEDSDDECHGYRWVGLGARLELGRLRYESFQFSLGQVFLAMDWTKREHMGFGLGGIGQHFRLDDTGRHELGYLVWPLSIFLDDALGHFITQIYYRNNDDESFIEAGIEDFLGDTFVMDPRAIPVHLYVQSGYPAARVNAFFEDTAAWTRELFTQESEAEAESASPLPWYGERAEYLSVTGGFSEAYNNIVLLTGELSLVGPLSIAVLYGQDMQPAEKFERYELGAQLSYYANEPFQGLHLLANARRGQDSHATKVSGALGVGYKWVGPFGITLFCQANLNVSSETERNDEGYWAATALEDPEVVSGDEPRDRDLMTETQIGFNLMGGAGWSF